MAGTDFTAVQHVLHRQVDVDAGGITCNLDTVAKSGDTSVCPAGAAVLTKLHIMPYKVEDTTRLVTLQQQAMTNRQKMYVPEASAGCETWCSS